MQPTLMTLKILLPSQIFAEETLVTRIIAETPDGSIGLLPHRLDCVASLTPGILIYQKEGPGEVYLAIDQGILVKSGINVLVSVRNVISGTDLNQLRESVQKVFLSENEREENMRLVMAKMESSFIRRIAEFHHE